jgi:hypothetical protein
MGKLVKQRYMLSVMCGRSTYKLTWEEIVRLYRLTLDQLPVNTQVRYNVCPTTTIDTIVGQNGERRLMPMRWGLVPSWWSKPLKELKLVVQRAGRDSRRKAVLPGSVQAQPLPDPCIGLLRMARHSRRQAAMVLHCTGRVAGADNRRTVGRMARQDERRDIEVLHHDYRRAERICRSGARSNAGSSYRKRL